MRGRGGHRLLASMLSRTTTTTTNHTRITRWNPPEGQNPARNAHTYAPAVALGNAVVRHTPTRTHKGQHGLEGTYFSTPCWPVPPRGLPPTHMGHGVRLLLQESYAFEVVASYRRTANHARAPQARLALDHPGGDPPSMPLGGVRPVVHHQPHCTPRARNTTAKQFIILDCNVRSHPR